MAVIDQDNPGRMDKFLSRFGLSKKWKRQTGRTNLEKILQKEEFTLGDTIFYQYYVKKRSDAITLYNEQLAKWKEERARLKQYVQGNMQAVAQAAQTSFVGAALAVPINKFSELLARIWNKIFYPKAAMERERREPYFSKIDNQSGVIKDGSGAPPQGELRRPGGNPSPTGELRDGSAYGELRQPIDAVGRITQGGENRLVPGQASSIGQKLPPDYYRSADKFLAPQADAEPEPSKSNVVPLFQRAAKQVTAVANDNDPTLDSGYGPARGKTVRAAPAPQGKRIA